MARSVLPVLLIAATGVASPAQIIGIELDPLAAKTQYAKWVTQWKGAPLVIGEPLEGVNISEDRTVSQVPGAKRYVMAVIDPNKPDLKLLDIDASGKRVAVAEDRVIAIDNKAVKHSSAFHIVMRDQTAEGLRTEYLRKMSDITSKRAVYKASKLGTPEFFTAQRNLLTAIDGAVAWMRGTLFPAAAAKLEAEYGAELKRGGAAASKSRLETAKKSLKPAEIADALVQFAGGVKWHGREAQHVRIISTSAVNASVLETAVLLAERIIEGFRVEFVDSLISGEESDPIPDKVFLEVCLVPDDEASLVRYYEGYYGKSLGHPREKTIKMSGHSAFGGHGADYLYLTRFAAGDLDGMVAHQLGHCLAALAFNRGSKQMPSWIDEGFAYWISFEYLSRNTVTCFQFNLPGYGREADKEGEKIVQQGLRASFNKLALEKGAPLGDLMRMKLADMSSADFAKAWSFVDFIAAKHRDKLVRLYRGACDSTNKHEQVELERFRPTLMDLFGVAEGDVYGVIEDQWKTFALTEQKAPRKAR